MVALITTWHRLGQTLIEKFSLIKNSTKTLCVTFPYSSKIAYKVFLSLPYFELSNFEQ